MLCIHSYKFKARPVDPRVYSDVSMGVKTVTHKEASKSEGFHFETDKRLLQREASKVHSESHYEFRARPLPAKILAGPVVSTDYKIKSNVKGSSTNAYYVVFFEGLSTAFAW